jgi:hypothetical protein
MDLVPVPRLVPLLALLVIAWLPGAVIFRVPWLDRDGRAALPAEERLFWAVIISLSVSLALVLLLAAAGQYSFGRLLAANLSITVLTAAVSGLRLRLGPAASRPEVTCLLPLALVVLGLWQFFPPAEYVIGGKDPGVYMAEGIQIAQRGTLVYEDPVVASVPAFARDLFFPSHGRREYHGLRFMGFFVRDPDRGTVVGQFPHLFPASVAIGYGLDGLTGARRTVGVWAVLGLLAVYFAGAHIAGRAAGFAASVLLSLHVVQVWFARYPNAEVVMQTFLFAGLLALARAHDGTGRHFFGAMAGVLLGLLLFLRVDAALAILAALAAMGLVVAAGGRWLSSFLLALALSGALAAWYMLGPLRAYAGLPIAFLTHNVAWWQFAGVGLAVVLAVVAAMMSSSRPGLSSRVRAHVPWVLAGAVIAGAIYALYFREPAGRLASHDAYALRHFVLFYLSVPALAAALAGFLLLARERFWRSPALLVTIAVFSFFFFYKIRIVPEHFWAARRFLPVILPGALLSASAAAAWGLRQTGWRRGVSLAIGVAFVVLLGTQYARASRPVIDHVEYAGIIPELERLAAQIGDDDLLLVESRDAGSDAHVFGLPLAYIYARQVLVLASVRPEREAFGPFLDWAATRYRAVYFLGGGGTDLLSRQWSARSVASRRFQVPEYESAWMAYPRGVRLKEFDFGLYELLPAVADPESWFDLDVGIHDDLHVIRFHAKEVADGRPMRWSQRQSFVSVPVFAPDGREVIVVMSSGGRPDTAAPAEVRAYLNDEPIGTVRVEDGFRPYAFTIPPALAATAAASEEPARLRLVTEVWSPRQALGTPDDRALGVMVDRVQVR